MNIFQIMGCTSDQYASLENYLVRKSKICKERGYCFVVAYNNTPKSKDFIKDLKSAGALLYKLEATSFLDFRFFNEFRRIIKKHKINIVHAYFAPTRHYAIIAAWLLGVKKRFRQGANLPLSRNNKTGLSFKLFLFQHCFLSLFATKYICRSKAVKSQYVEMGINSHKLLVADGGTDADRYNKKLADKKKLLIFNITNDYLVIGTASRLVKEKGLEILIAAIELLINQNYKIVCFIMGEGPEMENLKALVKEKQLDDSVKFPGHKSDLENYYNLFDIYVSTSFSEGMSNSILEAMACKRPVILSDIEPNKEIFETAAKSNLYVGELFEAGDKKDLAEKIKILIEKEDRRTIGEAARKVIVNNYSIDKRINKEFEIYQEV